MLPWKRKEVYMGMSQEECFQIRDKLDAAGIQSEYKVVGHSLLGVSGGGRKDGGDRRALHYLYVKKEDYEKARSAARI